MEALKNVYNQETIALISNEIKKVYKSFKQKKFEQGILSHLQGLELKERVKLISDQLKLNLPENYKESISIVLQIIETDKDKNEKWQGNKNKKLSGFLVWPLTQFIEDYGLDDPKTSLMALKELTKSFTGEFAIRPFINKYPELCFKYFKQWSTDKNHHVRRLVSEGTRPKLPWAKQVPYLNTNPEERISLLMVLKNDESDYVRKSISNHLNDISKTHPKLFFQAIKQFDLENPLHKRMVLHAARTLIKAGDKEIYNYLNLSQSNKVKIENVKLEKKKIALNERLQFQVELSNKSNTGHNLIIHYSIHFLLKNNKLGEKKFLLAKTHLKKNESKKIEKSHLFKLQTTRALYSGKHKISFYLNGVLQETLDFNLKL